MSAFGVGVCAAQTRAAARGAMQKAKIHRIALMVALAYTLFLAVLPFLHNGLQQKLDALKLKQYYLLGLPVVFGSIYAATRSLSGVARFLSRLLALGIVGARKPGKVRMLLGSRDD
jgi:hypothetical protein